MEKVSWSVVDSQKLCFVFNKRKRDDASINCMEAINSSHRTGLVGRHEYGNLVTSARHCGTSNTPRFGRGHANTSTGWKTEIPCEANKCACVFHTCLLESLVHQLLMCMIIIIVNRMGYSRPNLPKQIKR